MLAVSQNYKDAIESETRNIKARITMKGVTYTNSDIFNVEYNSGSITGETFNIGSTFSNNIKVTFSSIIEELLLDDQVKLEFGVVLSDSTIEYVKMGTFFITSYDPQRNDFKTVIEASDKMIQLNGTYESELSYPSTIKKVALEIANKAGLLVNETSFARLSDMPINEPIGYTYRQALGLIAQFECGFALFDRNGLLDIRMLSDPEYTVNPDSYFSKGLTKDETNYQIGGINCKVVTKDGDSSETTTLQSGSTSGAQISLENSVMTQTLLDGMYQKLRNLNYFPFSLSWRGNPALEAGDWITVVDLKGVRLKVPNLNYKFSFSGGLKAVSSANTQTVSASSYQYKGNLQQQIYELSGRIGAAGNHIYDGNAQPILPKEGDLWFKPNGPDTEIRIYQNGEWVFQVSTATNPEIAEAIEQAQTEATEAKTAAQDAVDKANASVAAVQANTQLINDVNTVANNAKTQAQTAATNAQTALTNANTAKDNANKAISDAGKLSEDVLVLDTIANQAKSDADTALINANKGITDAKTALDKATGVDTQVTTEITNVNNSLATKANSTTVDALSDTVSSQGTAISQNATDIKLKADSTVVNAIKGTVDSQGTLISQNASDIKIKADKSIVDTLSGRVLANETAIDVTAQGVSTLVTKTDGTNTSLSQFKQDYEGFKGTVYSKTQTDTKISTVQSTVDNFKTTVSNTYSSKSETDNKVAVVQANVNKIGNYTAWAYSADGTDRFTTVYPNLNLIEDGKFAGPLNSKWYTDGTTISKDSITGYFRVKFNGTGSYNRAYYTASLSTIQIGQKYSVYIKAYSLESSLNIKIGSVNTSQAVTVTNNSNIPKTYKVEGLIRGDSNTFGIFGGLTTTIGTLFISEIKLEPGSTATPWMPSEKEQTSNDIPKYVGYSVRQSENPKDFSWQPYSGLNSYKIIEATTSIEQNSKEIALKANKTEVDTLSGKVSTAEGNITTMAGQISLKANQSDVDTVTKRVTATESSLSLQDGKITALTSRTDGNSTQIGKLQTSYDGLSSTVATVQTSVSNINTSNTNLLIRKNEVKDSMVGSDGTIQNYNGSSVIGYSDRISVTGGESLYFSQYYANMSADNYFRYAFYNSTGTLITRAVNNTINFLVVVPSGASYLRVSYATANKVKVERGNSNTGFVLNPEDTATFVQYSNLSQTVSSLQSTVADKASTAQVAILSTQVTSVVSDVSTQKSQITQLATDINLRVSKGDVTSQINIEAGRTLIDTKQLLLNADTVKFSGSAFIPNAMIQNLSAEKITAGTLNAANVNVINLNARALTAGTISGTNLSMNLDTGAVQFQKGVIKKEDSRFSIDITNGVIESYSPNGGYTLKDGEISFRDISAQSPSSIEKYGSISYDWFPGGLFSSSFDAISVKGTAGWGIGTANAKKGFLAESTLGTFIGGNNKRCSVFAEEVLELYGGKTFGSGISQGQAMVRVGVTNSGSAGGDGIDISANQLRIYTKSFSVSLPDQASIVAEEISMAGKCSVLGNLSVTGSKNAIHVTRDGVRATPAYETAESYLGDIGRSYTRENYEVWVEIDPLFSDTVNIDIAYEVFLQAYDNARFWVSDFRSDKFLVKSDKPMSRFAWELKAKRRGYENERLVLQKDIDYEKIEKEWRNI